MNNVFHDNDYHDKMKDKLSNRNGHRDHTDDESNNIVHDNITFGIQKGAE